MGAHPVAFFEVVSPDADRSRKFYADLFGWTIETDDHGYGLVSTGDDTVGGGIGPSAAPGDTGVKVYVRTDNLEQTIERAATLGSQTLVEPVALPGDYGRIAVVTDPDGNALGLWS
jgi:predicted enzyme related to lactoylglutathione lyase